MDGKRLKQAMDAKGISQRKLAEMTGVNECTISKYIHEEIKSGEIIKELCNALNVSADWILGIDRKDEAANMDAVRRSCKEYMLGKVNIKETIIKIIQIAMNGERG